MQLGNYKHEVVSNTRLRHDTDDLLPRLSQHPETRSVERPGSCVRRVSRAPRDQSPAYLLRLHARFLTIQSEDRHAEIGRKGLNDGHFQLANEASLPA